jgi:hypothetical protein
LIIIFFQIGYHTRTAFYNSSSFVTTWRLGLFFSNEQILFVPLYANFGCCFISYPQPDMVWKLFQTAICVQNVGVHVSCSSHVCTQLAAFFIDPRAEWSTTRGWFLFCFVMIFHTNVLCLSPLLFCLSPAFRASHIKREKTTSNTCSHDADTGIVANRKL